MYLVVHSSLLYMVLVTSSLVRETTETESQDYGYKFGQEERTYNIVALGRLSGRLLPIRLSSIICCRHLVYCSWCIYHENLISTDLILTSPS